MATPPKVEQVIFSAQIEELEPVMEWVRSQASRSGLADNQIRKVELALEEAFINVVQHAYKGGKGVVEIVCNLYPQDKLEFIVRDKGPPFNPLLQVPSIQPLAPLEEREEGGLGIALMRHSMDQILYQRQHPYNILTLCKRIAR
jgi:serine/threonine-protein kinase RsbW